jgi:hypothetical protein
MESVGDQHAVFLEGISVAHAKDTSFAPGVRGSPAIARASTSTMWS